VTTKGIWKKGNGVVMGNKSKKKANTKVLKKPVPQKELPEFLKGRRTLTEEERKAATQRIVNLFKAVSATPEPILDMLYRLEIPWRRSVLKDEHGESVEYILIKADDLAAGEERNQSKGSLANRIYEGAKSNPLVSHNDSDNSDSSSGTVAIPHSDGSNEALSEGVKEFAKKLAGAVNSANAEYRAWKAGMNPVEAVEYSETSVAVNDDDLTEDYLKGIQG